MLKKSLFAVAFAFVSFQTTAQSKFDLEVGMNAAPLWMSDFDYTPSIMVQAGLFEDVHLRIQAGYESNWKESDRNVRTSNAFFSSGTMDSTITYTPGEDNNLFLAAALLNEHDLGNDFYGYYGIELSYQEMVQSWKERQEIVQEFQQGNRNNFQNDFDYTRTTNSMGYSLLGGFRYNASKRIAISLETSIQIISREITTERSTTMMQWNEFNPQVFRQSNESKGTVVESLFGIRPISALLISFQL